MWRNSKKADKIDLLEHNHCNVMAVVLKGSDGGVQHGIGIWGNALFDSTQGCALTLCKESLDWCCGGKDASFVGVYKAIRIIPKAKQFVKSTQKI